MRKHEPEIERRRRQLEVIEKKARTAEARKDQAAMDAARVSYEATTARIAELEAAEQAEPEHRRRRKES